MWLGTATGAHVVGFVDATEVRMRVDPPRDEVKKRGDFRGRPLPSGHPGSAERVRAILSKSIAVSTVTARWISPINFDPAQKRPSRG